MSLQLSAVTLGVKDINRAKKFYNEGLGCAVDQDHAGFVSLKVGDSKVSLGLYTTDALADDGDTRVARLAPFELYQPRRAVRRGGGADGCNQRIFV